MSSYVILIYSVRNYYFTNIDVYHTLSWNLTKHNINYFCPLKTITFKNCDTQQSCSLVNTWFQTSYNVLCIT
jgi:hypothetical protein